MKTDRYRLERILEIGSQLLDVMDRRGITADDVEGDLETQWLITTPRSLCTFPHIRRPG